MGAVEDAAKVLDGHFILWADLNQPHTAGPLGEWVCGCGKKFGFSATAIRHLAQELAEAGLLRPVPDTGDVDAHRVEAERLLVLAESESWYEDDGRLPRVRAILAAAQVHATLAREAGTR